MLINADLFWWILIEADADAVTPGVTQVGAYHRPSDVHFPPEQEVPAVRAALSLDLLPEEENGLEWYIWGGGRFELAIGHNSDNGEGENGVNHFLVSLNVE